MGRLRRGTWGVEAKGTGLETVTGGGNTADERGISMGWRCGVGGGGMTLRCLCVW